MLSFPAIQHGRSFCRNPEGDEQHWTVRCQACLILSEWYPLDLVKWLGAYPLNPVLSWPELASLLRFLNLCKISWTIWLLYSNQLHLHLSLHLGVVAIEKGSFGSPNNYNWRILVMVVLICRWECIYKTLIWHTITYFWARVYWLNFSFVYYHLFLGDSVFTKPWFGTWSLTSVWECTYKTLVLYMITYFWVKSVFTKP